MEKSNFIITENFLHQVACFEGFRSKAYLCPAGVLTIGYGHTDDVKKGDKITREQALSLLYADLLYCAHLIFKHLDCSKFTLYQIYALIDFSFNLGFYRLQTASFWVSLRCYSSSSDGVRANLDDYICVVMQKYNKYRKNGVLTVSDGLAERRKFEVRLWRNDPTLRF